MARSPIQQKQQGNKKSSGVEVGVEKEGLDKI